MKRRWTDKEIDFWTERIRAKRNDSPFFGKLNDFVNEIIVRYREAEQLKLKLQQEMEIEKFLKR